MRFIASWAVSRGTRLDFSAVIGNLPVGQDSCLSNVEGGAISFRKANDSSDIRLGLGYEGK